MRCTSTCFTRRHGLGIEFGGALLHGEFEPRALTEREIDRVRALPEAERLRVHGVLPGVEPQHPELAGRSGGHAGDLGGGHIADRDLGTDHRCTVGAYGAFEGDAVLRQGGGGDG